MPNYVVETYLSREQTRERRTREDRVRSAAAELTRAGTAVRLEFAIHVPEDETSFYVFQAPSAHHSALAAQGAGLDPIRVVEALTSKGTEQWDGN
jgi:hypothetical protein